MSESVTDLLSAELMYAAPTVRKRRRGLVSILLLPSGTTVRLSLNLQLRLETKESQRNDGWVMKKLIQVLTNGS